MSASTTAAPHSSPGDHKPQSKFKTLMGTSVGNALEWYDWNVYASFAVYFSTQVFDNSNPQSAFLNTMAVFAVGFVARPFGGFVFGWLGDRVGRKHSLTLAVIAASLGSLLIAVCPTYDKWGWGASALLVFARLLQGLAHGGEMPSAQTYLAEHSPQDKRGLFASSIYVTGTIGLLVGLALGLILQSTLDDAQMDAWGWRIPFAVGAVMGLGALWIRSSMEESEVFEEHRAAVKDAGEKEKNIFAEVGRNWRVGLKVIGMTCGLTVAYYIWSVSMASVAKSSFGYTANDSFTASLIGNVVFIVVLPAWGFLSDKIGRKPSMLIALIGTAILYIPMMKLVMNGGHMWELTLAISLQLVLLAGFLSHAPATYAEMFPTSQRTAGFGIYYAIVIAVFGGTAPYVLTWLGSDKFAWYSIILLVVSAISVLFLPETKGKDLSTHNTLEDEAADRA
jgi:MHS family alpha-ketoglutarate permease-like MFS transporter